MSLQEIEEAVERLSSSELAVFRSWLEEFAARSLLEKEHSSWSAFSAKGLAAAYSDSEPEYTSADVRHE